MSELLQILMFYNECFHAQMQWLNFFDYTMCAIYVCYLVMCFLLFYTYILCDKLYKQCLTFSYVKICLISVTLK